MGVKRRATLVGLIGVLFTQGCGSSSSSSGSNNGGLTLRAQWQQTAGAPSGAAALDSDGTFGPTIPPSAKSVVVLLEPAIGVRRCIAVDPLQVPLDPVTHQHVLILRSLPAGPATVTLFGFATEPDRAHDTCVGARLDTPSFRSDPHSVTIVAATRTDVDIKVFALPFLLDLNPPAEIPPVSLDSPVPVGFTIVDAVSGIDSQSVTITSPAAGNSVSPGLSACDDAGPTPCSDGASLGVSGFRTLSDTTPLAANRIHIGARNLGAPPRELDFSYDVIVRPNLNPGLLTGRVINCVTGDPLAASVSLLQPEARTTQAGNDGRFAFDSLALGDFRVRATATGFNDSELSGTLTIVNPEQDITIPLCPPIPLRTVLTWGSGPPAPQDLDAHLRGPAPGTGVNGAFVDFHLFFTNRAIEFPSGLLATLDLDSRNFSGPETDSVTELAPGIYHYCVHDFSDRTDPQSDGLTRSGARVQAFVGDQQVGEFSAPIGRGNVWDVFVLDTTQQPPRIVPINTLVAEALSERVCHDPNDPDGDGLSNSQEATVGTDPQISDTNGNGVSDGQDVINGTDPLPPRTPTPTQTPTVTP